MASRYVSHQPDPFCPATHDYDEGADPFNKHVFTPMYTTQWKQTHIVLYHSTLQFVVLDVVL